VLRVCVGRLKDSGKDCPARNILREWYGGFSSLHELMCAVEASWVSPDDCSVPLAAADRVAGDYDSGGLAWAGLALAGLGWPGVGWGGVGWAAVYAILTPSTPPIF